MVGLGRHGGLAYESDVMHLTAARRPLARPRDRVSLDERVRAALRLGLVATLAVAAYAAIRATGGTPNALAHLGYIPIVLAAYLFGWRASLPTAILVTLLIGPFGELTGMRTDGPQAWAARGVAFIGIGLLLGILFDRMRSAVAEAEANARLVRDREREAIVAFARGAEAKDEDTGHHVVRVQDGSLLLARSVGLDPEDADRIGWSAMLHDVGKLHVPDRILLKPGPLDAGEWAIMRQHPVWGERILGDGAGFETARRIARWHHENFDGSGYPDGLRGEDIPLEARIVRLADAFDAMTSRRVYAEPRTIDDALEEIERWAGRQFDPELARLFIGLMERERSTWPKAA
jgi:hypothetical protein